ncbi:MAG TPA: bifunctional DNA-binding transcriptional regulator/O6-methylguanine-DNA methyltransferase Ada [Gemmatimonas sp.]|nr:bifunctional DNA-binding transcriptional regulator/O6-methylguanine-DNA methyltransferase Ada [Gemmatimonas sp.]
MNPNPLSSHHVYVPHASSDPRHVAVLARDRAFDGAFVFAVTSTGIYCRPSCPARRPRADRVRFFASPANARVGGFRACLRCKPDAQDADAGDAATRGVVKALLEIEQASRPMSLDALADAAGMSRAHFQRVFTRVVGCSPHQWQTAQRAERLRSGLTAGAPVTSAAFAAGFESLPRAYAAAEHHFGVTPGALRRGAPGETVFYTVAQCALGHVLVAMTSRGVCRVIVGDGGDALVEQLGREMHAATLVADDPAVRETARAVVHAASGATLAHPLPLDLRGTAFQQRVWKELTRIPRGETITYGELARRIGAPGAVRAVGTACGANPAAVIVPCHRVLRGDGSLGGYRWGVERKAMLLRSECDGEPVEER